MDSLAQWIIVLVIIAIGIGFTALQISSHKDQIRQVLERKGAKNIQISWQPFDFDRSNHTYSVEYDDIAGNKQYTSCKIHTWGSTIYWENKP